jgi:hypothetical protein
MSHIIWECAAPLSFLLKYRAIDIFWRQASGYLIRCLYRGCRAGTMAAVGGIRKKKPGLWIIFESETGAAMHGNILHIRLPFRLPGRARFLYFS